MNPQEQCVAIAKALGWQEWTDEERGIFSGDWSGKIWTPPGKPNLGDATSLPDFTNDLNAMAMAERALTPDEHYRFRLQLWDITKSHGPHQFDGVNGEAHSCRYVSATAPQRCEAWLKAKSLWK